MGTVRADKLLQQKGLAASRTQAQDLIEGGQAFFKKDGKLVRIEKVSQLFDETDELVVETGPIGKFASRGGLKLEGALDHVKLDVRGLKVLDIGQSTGGFTDCLLQRGASRVVGIDVGQGQLHEKLRQDRRVQFFESLHVKDLGADCGFLESLPAGGFDLVVADVSFISLTLALPHWAPFLRTDGFMLSLVKPQFEVGPENLDGAGIVKDPSLAAVVEHKIRAACAAGPWEAVDYFPSEWTGKDGNREFFIYARKT